MKHKKLTNFLILLFSGSRKKKFILLELDLFGAISAFFFSYWISTRVFLAGVKFSEYIPIFFIFTFFLALSLYFMNGYKPIEDRRTETELEIIVKSSTLAFLLVLAVTFIVFKGEVFSRYLIVSWWISITFALILFRFGLRETYKSLWRRGYLRQKVLLIGDEGKAKSVMDHIIIQRHNRFDFLSIDVEGYNDKFRDIIKEHNVDRVIIIPEGFLYENVSEITNFCRLKSVAVNIVSSEFSATDQKISIDEYTGFLTLETHDGSPFSKRWNKLLKRSMDIVISLAVLPIVGFFYVIIGTASKVEDRGPVIFRRRVVGKNGKEFDAFKFRSMFVNANEILEKNSELKKEFEKNYKLENDPRLTKVGAFIRKLSIDEFLQIINVFLGQMSFIGPRMKVKEEIEKYYGDFKDKLLTFKPGITGYWQVNGRQTTNYDERVRMDMFYIDHWSIWMDIVILFKTVWTVIKREGAF